MSEPYYGPAAAFRDSKWLAATDLIGLGDVVVEIEYAGMLNDEDKKTLQFGTVKGCLKFKGRDKEMLINATNNKLLCMMFGSLTKNWAGKKVAIYADSEVKQKGGKKGYGIRIRAAAPNRSISEAVAAEEAQS
jgi:hypothetical protein